MTEAVRGAVGIIAGIAFAATLAIFPVQAEAQEGAAQGAAADPKASAAAPKVMGVEFEALRQPAVDQARQTYPEAKARYLAGLPEGSRFFVTVDFQEGGLRENAFVRVREISGGAITGTVAMRLSRLKSPALGEQVMLPEAEILDWTIISKDGKEEGNFVGKFLDEYSKTHP